MYNRHFLYPVIIAKEYGRISLAFIAQQASKLHCYPLFWIVWKSAEG